MSNTTAERLNDKWLRLYGIPLAVTAGLVAQMPFYFPGRWDEFWQFWLISVIFAYLMWEISRKILMHLRDRFPNLEQTKQRLFWMFLVAGIQFAIGQVIVINVFFMLGLRLDATLSFSQTWLRYFSANLFFIFVVLIAFEATYFFRQYKKVIQKAEHLKKQQAQQRLDTLKNRVNPHFLFNSLTTLSALIGEDAPKAEHFVDELSKVYRYLLRAARQPTVTLREELQFAESYVFLLKNRFEDGAFTLSVQQRGDLAHFDQNLPALTLQNALDFFVRTQNLPLKIEVNWLGKHLQITCAHQPKSISFDAPDNDWRQLEAHGAKQEIRAGKQVILIPFTQNTLPS